jgi:hypothetical protein
MFDIFPILDANLSEELINLAFINELDEDNLQIERGFIEECEEKY